MASLEQYANNYDNIRFERRDGILQMTFHTNGGPLQWGSGPHEEFPRAFADVGSDRDNRVIILTGSGDTFSGPQGTAAGAPKRPPRDWDRTYWEGKKLLGNLLDIEVPMIAACQRACPSSFRDSPPVRHRTGFQYRRLPGLRPLHEQSRAGRRSARCVSDAARGPIAGATFSLPGSQSAPRRALSLGLVGEVLPPDDLLPRAWELAPPGRREVRPRPALHPGRHHPVHQAVDAGSPGLRPRS